MDDKVLEAVSVLVSEARASLAEDKQLRKDNTALRAEVQKLRAKVAVTETELDKAGRVHAGIGGELESVRRERDAASARAAGAEQESAHAQAVLEDVRREALGDAKGAMDALGDIIICVCGNVRNAQYRQCFICKSTDTLPV
ncbi:MAG: hypothetical protein LN413_00585 [Candidatus Thermoplasmatota archaeon]|nr:hypothetical protein [Candidatus Thermoplasmatota archaeon]